MKADRTDNLHPHFYDDSGHEIRMVDYYRNSLYRVYAYNPLLDDYEPVSLPMPLTKAREAKKRAQHGGLYSSVKLVRYTGNQLNFLEQ